MKLMPIDRRSRQIPTGSNATQSGDIVNARRIWTVLVAATALIVAVPTIASAAAPAGDKTAPAVTAVTPVNGSINVGVTAAPTAKFSEAIQPATVTATFVRGTTAVPFTLSYNATTFIATLTSNAVLAYSTRYSLTIKAKDLAGNQMTGPAPGWSFTTAATPPPPPVDNPPVADLHATPISGESPVWVHLDASGSTDDVGIVAYTFEWGDGTANTGEQGDSVADHAYTAIGTWTAKVTVKDTGGHTASATQTITVTAPAPPPVDNAPVAALSVTPNTGVAPLAVTADASASTDDHGIVSYAFDFGDGNVVPAQGASTVQHSYANDGQYVVTVTVVDTAGTSAQATSSVTVNAPPPPPPPATKPTSVVLTFDDGTVGQDDAAQVLHDNGLHGTFYINSGRLGFSGYLTATGVQGIASLGNEIAGHTVDHADLTTLSADDAAREICNDRVALHNLGVTVKNFAYPFGAYNAAIEQQVAACGYNSGRIIANLKSVPYGCANCVTANPIPPTDLYAIKTNTSVRSDTTLNILQTYVTQAENDKGGLVPIVFHHVSADNPTGDPNWISTDEFTQFVQWLKTRPSTTQVQTIDQVIGGAEQAYVAGPPLPTQNPNLVQNYSLEQVTSGVPSGFQLGSSGVNTATWSYSTDAHSGTHSERVDITAYTSGDRKLVMKQDASTISPQVTPGHTYTASVWAKGSGPVTLIAFYRDATGAWKYWQQSPTRQLSSGWAQSSWVTAPVPAGATAVSFGFGLLGVGNLTTDDYALLDNG
jgi:PKD repeat protein